MYAVYTTKERGEPVCTPSTPNATVANGYLRLVPCFCVAPSAARGRDDKVDHI